MRRASVFTIALAGLVLAVPSAAVSLGEVAADGKLVVLYTDTDSPFIDQTEEGPRGFDYDVLQGFAARHGLTVEPVALPDVAELIPAVRAGRGELIAGAFTHNSARAREVLFTSEVTPQRHVVVSLEPAAVVDSLDRLRALGVGTVAGTSWEAAARAAGVPASQLDATLPLDATALVTALGEKRVDAVVTGLVYALLMRRDEPRLRLGLLLGEPGYHAYAMAPGSEALREALDTYLAGVRDTAGWYRLLIKHFGADAPEMFRRARNE